MLLSPGCFPILGCELAGGVVNVVVNNQAGIDHPGVVARRSIRHGNQPGEKPTGHANCWPCIPCAHVITHYRVKNTSASRLKASTFGLGTNRLFENSIPLATFHQSSTWYGCDPYHVAITLICCQIR